MRRDRGLHEPTAIMPRPFQVNGRFPFTRRLCSSVTVAQQSLENLPNRPLYRYEEHVPIRDPQRLIPALRNGRSVPPSNAFLLLRFSRSDLSDQA